MQKTNNKVADDQITLDIEKLSALLSCGRFTADKIGRNAGARIQVGRRVLYNRKKIELYLDSLTN